MTGSVIRVAYDKFIRAELVHNRDISLDPVFFKVLGNNRLGSFLESSQFFFFFFYEGLFYEMETQNVVEFLACSLKI